MQPSDTEFFISVNGNHQDNIDGLNSPPKGKDQNDISQNIVELSSSDSEDENTLSRNGSNQHLVLYDPSINGGSEVENFPEPISYKAPPFNKIIPSVDAFAVQCANCLKWRLIPTQEKYQEIREFIIQKPFVCTTAREWRPDISCNDPPDVEQDGSRLWAIDQPSIARPPSGWRRNLRIRAEGGTKFGDIYYDPPTGGKALRSITEIERYLFDHPECGEQGVTLAQFSFRIPKPLQEDYVRKRPHRAALPDINCMRMPESFQPLPALAMPLPGPYPTSEMQLAMYPTTKIARISPGNS